MNDILACDGLSPRERSVVELRMRDGLRHLAIARRLGITTSQVHNALVAARQRANGTRPPARTTRTQRPVMDADWWPRQIAYVRSLEHSPDPTHQTRYLRGIAIVWGQEVADEVERRAGA